MAPKGPPYGIPDGFPDLLQKFVVHILKHQPENIVDCAVDYFVEMQNQNKVNSGQSIKVGTSNVMSYLNVSSNTEDDTKLNQISESLIASSHQNLPTEAVPSTHNANKEKSGIISKVLFQRYFRYYFKG